MNFVPFTVMIMHNKELLYLCRQHAAGQISWPDYRNYRAQLLQQLTYDGESTMPVEQALQTPDPDKTAPMSNNGGWGKDNS